MQLNMEQRKLIQAKPVGHNLIKGVAGSGKTTVALHKTLFLRNHYCFGENERILLVTYNRTLINYIKYLYEKIEDEHKDLYINIFDNDENKVDIQTIDKIIYDYYMKTEESKKYKIDFDKKTRYSLLTHCIPEIRKKYPKVKIMDQENLMFLLDEIDWIKSCNYMELEEYQHADRLGRMSYQSTDGGPQKLMKNSDTRRAIFELMVLFDKKFRENNIISMKDAALAALKYAWNYVEKTYNHIIVDESQDLTRVQLEFLKLLSCSKDTSSITFIADTAQSIYAHSWLVKGRSFASIGFDMTGKSSSLNKNYRTTTQIAQAAFSLIEKDKNIIDDENFVKPYLIDKQGSSPVYKHFKRAREESSHINYLIEQLLEKGYTYKDMAIISRNQNQLKCIQEEFDQNNKTWVFISKRKPDFELDGIKMMTMHSIKGLEFKVVFIVGINKDILPFVSYLEKEEQSLQESQERKLFYVGMTRATELLFLSSSKKPSKFIKDIEPAYLKLTMDSRIKCFYDVKLDNYLYQDKIFNLFSEEEKIRQWVLTELIDNYKYPKELVDVECKINEFSKIGFVDIVVNIYSNNNPQPYIFIETKAWGDEISSGLNQLKSYMSHSKTCQYGVITNGNDFRVIDQSFQQVSDIPPFHPSMIPNDIQTYYYHNLKRSTTVELLLYNGTHSELNVQQGTLNITYTKDQLKKLPVFENVAAGLPVFMNEKAEEEFFLPQRWFDQNIDIFMLKVKGDSMEGANIFDGDYVVVEKKQAPQNRDIVIVALGEEATLKRFLKMGDTILLIPENEKYEAIQLQDDQARIMGIAVGVIQKK